MVDLSGWTVSPKLAHLYRFQDLLGELPQNSAATLVARGTILQRVGTQCRFGINSRAGKSAKLFPNLTTMASQNVPPPVTGRRGREGALQVGARKRP